MGSIFSPPSPGGTMPPPPDARLRQIQRQRREELMKKGRRSTILTAGLDDRPTIPTAGLDIRPTILTAGLDPRLTVPTKGLNIRPTILTAGLDAQTPPPAQQQPAQPQPTQPQPAQPQPAQPEQPKPEQPKPEKPKPEKPKPEKPKPEEPDPKRCEPILDELMQVNREMDALRREESNVRAQIDGLEEKIARLKGEEDRARPPPIDRPLQGSGGRRASRLFRILNLAVRRSPAISTLLTIKQVIDAGNPLERRRAIVAAEQELAARKARLEEILEKDRQKKFNRGLLERRLADCEKANGRPGRGP